MASYIWIKNDMPMVAFALGKNTFSIFVRSIIAFIECKCQRLRHTFAVTLFVLIWLKSGMNPKTLQYLMGHSDISVTLNTYTHIGYDDAKEELKRVVNGE